MTIELSNLELLLSDQIIQLQFKLERPSRKQKVPSVARKGPKFSGKSVDETFNSG